MHLVVMILSYPLTSQPCMPAGDRLPAGDMTLNNFGPARHSITRPAVAGAGRRIPPDGGEEGRVARPLWNGADARAGDGSAAQECEARDVHRYARWWLQIADAAISWLGSPACAR